LVEIPDGATFKYNGCVDQSYVKGVKGRDWFLLKNDIWRREEDGITMFE
jgi:hypothetical protein